MERQRQEAIIKIQRNAIAADLRQIQADLRLDLLQARREQGERFDPKTVLILEWHQSFTRVLSECEHPQQEFDEFKDLLRQILEDSIYSSALDENCLLGNDGGTYTEMGLQIYRNLAPAQFQNRSPLDPKVERPLETSPHVYARYMVAWLGRHNIQHRNAQNDIIEEAYRQLKLVANRVPPPAINQMDRDERMRRIMEHQAQRQMQRDRARNEQVQAERIQYQEQLRAMAVPMIQRSLAEVEQRIGQVAQRQLAQAQNLNQDIRQEINVLEAAIHQRDVELVELEQREAALEGKNNRLQAGVAALRATHRQMDAEKIQLKKQINESERAGLKSIGNALLTIGLCAFGSVVLKCVFEALGAAAGSGSTLLVKPKPGGFLLEGTIKF